MPVRSVKYTNHRAGKEVYVDRLASVREITGSSPQLRELILRSYVHAYEEDDSGSPGDRLPRGTIAAYYSKAHDKRYRDTAVAHFERGSQFWVAREDSAVVAFAKVTPGEALYFDSRPETVYINDVVVDPSYQRKGYGRTAVHAALAYGDSANVPVWLEAFEASEDRLVDGRIVAGRNELYKKMNLERVGGAKAFKFPRWRGIMDV